MTSRSGTILWQCLIMFFPSMPNIRRQWFRMYSGGVRILRFRWPGTSVHSASPVIDQYIGNVSRENALFSLATALPDIVPNLLSLPWAIGEFASDTAFLTGNQIRMTFLIAAASDHDVGYREQKGQIGSIVAGTFGFRAFARELIGKIPFRRGPAAESGGGLRGDLCHRTVNGEVLQYRLRVHQQERKSTFEGAFERGKEIAANLLETLRARRA